MPASFTNTSNLHQSVQLLAEYLHTASGMHVGIHDFERRYEVAAGDECENLCRFCRRTCTSFIRKCFCCDTESLAQVYRTGQRLIYRCHMGLTEVILPVTDEDQLLGVLFLGQVRIVPDASLSFENLYARLAAQYPEEICEKTKPALKAAYENTAVMTQEKLESFIGLTVIAEKGTRVDHWLNHFKLTTKAIVRQYLEYAGASGTVGRSGCCQSRDRQPELFFQSISEAHGMPVQRIQQKIFTKDSSRTFRRRT